VNAPNCEGLVVLLSLILVIAAVVSSALPFCPLAFFLLSILPPI
jgi:hypothetical protein